ncbi:hypothetical protein GCM10027569_27050 [Flindersiella endophytica]
MMPMHCERRAEHRPEMDSEARPGTGEQLAGRKVRLRQLLKRVDAQGPATRDRAVQNRDRADLLPPQTLGRPTQPWSTRIKLMRPAQSGGMR